MMKKAFIRTVFVAFLLIAAAGCATLETAHHNYMMKGQILEVNDGEVHLCIGSAEGAKTGQEFAVFRYLKIPYGGPKQTGPSFKREAVGSIKITQIVDEHFAQANVLTGEIKINDVAELAP